LGISYLTYFLIINIILSDYSGKTDLFMEAYHFWLIVVSLFVCGVSLVNSTMISVLERYREIGTMKCLGALDNHILRLLLIEALILGLAGGIVGFALGTSISVLSCCLEIGFNIILRLPLTKILEFSIPILALSVILSVISTAYPAFRAAKLQPVEALRYDV
ncbi:FtsX-like permease family protein, partial [Candidatus Bathyarchaeota archaeon]|nr:FtsX-like permease family protein [Candidatus Bathyarchaeota archaeon]